jgi:pheromone shutdown-related protein TraB
MNQTTKRIEVGGRTFILLGTAHVSRESVDEVAAAIASEKPDRVCVELDADRLRAMRDERGWHELDIVKVLREGKGFLLLANLVLASFQRRMGADVGVKPGAEMRAAVEAAEAAGVPTSLVDRPIQVTLRRAWSKNGLWGRAKLIATLLASAFSDEKLTAEDIEGLKDRGAMDGMMDELAGYLPTVKEVLIDERDRYLASGIWNSPGDTVLAVLGAGHLPGTEARLRAIASGAESANVGDIAEVAQKRGVSRVTGYIFPALLLGLFAAGFLTGGVKASGELILRWFLWNGSLAALGAILALGHPIAVIASFVFAPVGTVNPLVAVGLFSGLAQAWARKPRVSDMEALSSDATGLRGFYRNRITRVLLVFMLSSLGGAIGNLIAVPALLGRIFG